MQFKPYLCLVETKLTINDKVKSEKGFPLAKHTTRNSKPAYYTQQTKCHN